MEVNQFYYFLSFLFLINSFFRHLYTWMWIKDTYIIRTEYPIAMKQMALFFISFHYAEKVRYRMHAWPKNGWKGTFFTFNHVTYLTS